VLRQNQKIINQFEFQKNITLFRCQNDAPMILKLKSFYDELCNTNDECVFSWNS